MVPAYSQSEYVRLGRRYWLCQYTAPIFVFPAYNYIACNISARVAFEIKHRILALSAQNRYFTIRRFDLCHYIGYFDEIAN